MNQNLGDPGNTDVLTAVAQRQADDLAWAIANVPPVSEGPWDAIPNKQVFYVGIDAGGQRMKLEHVSSLWRYEPELVLLSGGNGVFHHVGTTGPVVVRIDLGPSMPGILVKRPTGQLPLQTDGLIDGKEFYFREEHGSWSLSIGSADVLDQPEWHHEETHDIGGSLSDAAVYDFIAKGAALFRSKTPSMATDAPQRQNNGEKE